MKILLISNICEQSGYSLAAESTLKSLYYNKVDVVARHISLTGHKRQVDSVVQKCLNKSAEGCDFLLIHSLPTYFEYDGNFKKCIGRFDYETPLVPSNWCKKCNLMDQIWVSTDDAVRDLVSIQVINKMVYGFTHATDINRFERDFSKTTGIIGRHKKKTGAYCFYTIGEFVARKNYEALLQAWYLAFSQKDNVDLFIKTSIPNVEPGQAKVQFMKCCEQIKSGLKLNKRYLKDPIVITEHFDDLAIDTFHANGDCFVSTSHAEGCCLPARDAILFGNPAILPDHTAFADFRHSGAAGAVYFIEAERTPCYGAFGQSPEIYNGMSSWFNVNILDFEGTLRFFPKNIDLKKINTESKNKLIQKYSYQSVGKQMIEALSV